MSRWKRNLGEQSLVPSTSILWGSRVLGRAGAERPGWFMPGQQLLLLPNHLSILEVQRAGSWFILAAALRLRCARLGAESSPNAILAPGGDCVPGVAGFCCQPHTAVGLGTRGAGLHSAPSLLESSDQRWLGVGAADLVLPLLSPQRLWTSTKGTAWVHGTRHHRKAAHKHAASSRPEQYLLRAPSARTQAMPAAPGCTDSPSSSPCSAPYSRASPLPPA